ncbi:hypothetical protein XENOCAPTIV_018759, partial [Xenoophorus captivus]
LSQVRCSSNASRPGDLVVSELLMFNSCDMNHQSRSGAAACLKLLSQCVLKLKDLLFFLADGQAKGVCEPLAKMSRPQSSGFHDQPQQRRTGGQPAAAMAFLPHAGTVA